MSDGQGGIVTPDAVVLDVAPATIGSRGIALMIDVAILFTGAILLLAAQAAFGFEGFVPDWLGIALLLLLAFALQFGYPIGFETLGRGRTPGKAVMGLRVITVEGAPVGLRHATVRAAVGLFELTMTLGGVAAIVSLVSSRGQRLGDLAAGTVVVRERRATRGGVEVATFAPPVGLERYVATLDVTGLDAADYATVRDTLRRADRLPAAARRRVSEQVASAVAGRVTPAPPDGIDALRYLACVAAAVQRRGDGAPRPRASEPVPPSAGAPPSAPHGVGVAWGVARPSPARTAEPVPSDGAGDDAAGTGGFAPPG